MFTKIAHLLDSMDLVFNISKKEGLIMVAVLPKHHTKKDLAITPFTCCATPEELDEKFLTELLTPMKRVAEFKSNAKEVEESVDEAEEEEEKADKKKAGTKKAAPAEKKVAAKKEEKPKAEKKAEVKKEEKVEEPVVAPPAPEPVPQMSLFEEPVETDAEKARLAEKYNVVLPPLKKEENNGNKATEESV